jgi:hypothetical protein
MGCTTSTLEFDITVDNPDLAYLAYAEVANLVDGFGWHTLHASRLGPAEFRTVTVWSTADLMSQLAGGNTITWTAGVMPVAAHTVTDGPHQLIITPPICLAFPTLTVPLIPSIPDFGPFPLPAQPLIAIQTDTPTATATASAVTCPPGTYYGEGSKSCVKIYLSPTPRSTNVPACKRYSDPSVCTSNGCTWDKGTSTCSK